MPEGHGNPGALRASRGASLRSRLVIDADVEGESDHAVALPGLHACFPNPTLRVLGEPGMAKCKKPG